MIKTRNPKTPDHRYFDVRLVSELDVLSAGYTKFVRAYGSYVLFRAKSFSSKFEELNNLDVEVTTEKKALIVLKKAQQAITLG